MLKVHNIPKAVGFDHQIYRCDCSYKKNICTLKVGGVFYFLVYFSRPLIVIGGSSDRNQETMGAFQEFPQVRRHTTFYKKISVK